MKTPGTLILKWATLPALAMLAAGCVAVAPIPPLSTGGDASNEDDTVAETSVTLCNIEGKQQQDLSDGTTKATVTQSCEETVVLVQNQHAEHPKRCRVAIAGQGTELYIKPGESRTLTQTGPVERTQIAIGCINDWNRPK
ncbi:MAG TPA: hypothetical protein VFV39_06900 [Limnobacter sp.]|nr:hypothetical protein [Limnobacter sp.]